jgi:ubiquinone/menaquinone biosynthesis C-methylase UbiE
MEDKMPKDKSLFHYGKTYHKLIDPLMKPSRQKIVDYIPTDSEVLDIGCGTGVLCFEFRQYRSCRVVGVDLSLRMINFAQANNPYDDVHFIHQDATDLGDFEKDHFDYAVISFLIHELFPNTQQRMVKEAWRVAKQVILVDSNAPLPWNIIGIFKRMIEIGFGFEHYPQFRSYDSSGGIMKILEETELDKNVIHRDLFSQSCNQLVVIAH